MHFGKISSPSSLIPALTLPQMAKMRIADEEPYSLDINFDLYYNLLMALVLEKKGSHLILVAYLAFTTTGMFTFMFVDALFVDFTGNTSASSTFFIPIDYRIDSLAVEVKIGGKIKNHAFLALGYGVLRMAAPANTLNASADFLHTIIKSITKTMFHTIKSTILLKLRI
jgi:hypothetical protein